MALQKGQQLLIEVGGNIYACQTTGSMNIDTNTIDTTCKEDGQFTSSIPGRTSWSIDVEGRYDPAAASDTGFVDIFDDIVSGATGTVKFGGTNSGDIFYTGTFYFTNVTLDAADDESVTWSATLTGYGPLTRDTVI